MRIIPVHSVKAGTKLAKNLYNDNGNILLKRGVELTPYMLEKIEENGICTIYIDDGYSDVEINDIIEPEVRLKATKAIRDTFAAIENYNSKMKDEVTDFKKKLNIKGMQQYAESLKSICDYIVDDITRSRQLMINLVDIKNTGSYIYQHSLNVAILSLVLGIELKLNKHDLYNLFIGSVLHDIGKAMLNPAIVNKITEYTSEEYEVIKSHTRVGYEYLSSNYSMEAPARIISLQHHEYYNGNGYPLGTSGEHIHKFARIVAITNTYDEMTSDTPNSVAIPPNEAIEYLMGSAGRLFDFDMCDKFVRKVNPYPIRSIVMLNDFRICVVRGENFNYPLRPKLEVIDKKGNMTGVTIDLMIETSIVIKELYLKDPRDQK